MIFLLLLLFLFSQQRREAQQIHSIYNKRSFFFLLLETPSRRKSYSSVSLHLSLLFPSLAGFRYKFDRTTRSL